jgi:hypothetical protein
VEYLTEIMLVFLVVCGLEGESMGDPAKQNPNNREELDISYTDAAQSKKMILIGLVVAIIILVVMLGIGPFSNTEAPSLP